ncbi:MAG: alpha/beta hydrolase [Deltaproteobacteria bacterium]|nr:alpha/beta hydrolase [Deltaproteobacteria bacterium]
MTAPASGHRHRVSLFIPARPAPDQGYPIVLLLDGDRAALHLRQVLAEGQSLDAVYVAIGYADTEQHAVVERALDYTPALEAGHRTPDPLDAEHRWNGGAAEFRQWLSAELEPEISRRVAVDWSQSTLWGHSYGGLFVLSTLLEAGSSYSRYVAADPSLWWQDAFLYRRLMDAPVVATELVLHRSRATATRSPRARTEAQRSLRESLTAALPAEAFERVAERWNATLIDYPEHDHGTLFEASLDALLERGAAAEGGRYPIHDH